MNFKFNLILINLNGCLWLIATILYIAALKISKKIYLEICVQICVALLCIWGPTADSQSYGCYIAERW